jgi:hypothetical protein
MLFTRVPACHQSIFFFILLEKNQRGLSSSQKLKGNGMNRDKVLIHGGIW